MKWSHRSQYGAEQVKTGSLGQLIVVVMIRPDGFGVLEDRGRRGSPQRRRRTRFDTCSTLTTAQQGTVRCG